MADAKTGIYIDGGPNSGFGDWGHVPPGEMARRAREWASDQVRQWQEFLARESEWRVEHLRGSRLVRAFDPSEVQRSVADLSKLSEEESSDGA